MESSKRNFTITILGYVNLIRALPGFLAILFIAKDQLLVACLMMASASLGDLIAGSIEQRAGWKKSESDVQIEGFVDFLCFVWAPAQLTLLLSGHWSVYASLGIFVLSGLYRLARFNVTGCQQTGYVGLPVTYNGIIFPTLALISFKLEKTTQSIILVVLIVILSLLMASKRFITPKWTL